MKRLLLVFALLGRIFGQTITNQCAEHNIYLSDTPTTISMSGAARCTDTHGQPIQFPGGIAVNYTCTGSSPRPAGMTVWGFDIPSACSTTSVAFAVSRVDTSTNNHYDIGLYYVKGPQAYQQYFGTLVVHTGIMSISPSPGQTNLQIQPWAECSASPCVLNPGQYALAVATDCKDPSPCAQLYGDEDTGFMYLFNVWMGGSSGTQRNGFPVNPALIFSWKNHQEITCVPQTQAPTCLFPLATSDLPDSIGTSALPVATDPTLSKSTTCSNGCPKPPAVLIY